jgi:hypothetical protein
MMNVCSSAAWRKNIADEMREEHRRRVLGERPRGQGSGEEPQRSSLCLHVGKRRVSTLLQGQLDTFHQQIMDFTPLVEGDLP